MRRVVITGAAGFTGLGSDWQSIRRRMEKGESCVRRMTEWEDIDGLNSKLGAPIEAFELPGHYTRMRTRTMGRNAKLAVRATELALAEAGLSGSEMISSGRTGIAYGSSSGSADALAEMAPIRLARSARSLNATSYVRMMSHTAAANIGLFFKVKGRTIPTISACTAGSQAIGVGFEAIRYGLQDIMLVGGSEELCPSHSCVFDILYATSTRNDQPELTPRPFDRDRDGLVIGEGSATLVLEDLQHALDRGAPILAEMVGFATNSDGNHISRPDRESMVRLMQLALDDGGLQAGQVDYICAHGTATRAGDIAESMATADLFGGNTPFASLKGYFGHTLGACGAIEAWLSVMMMRDDWFAPNHNLENIDPQCGRLDYIMERPRQFTANHIMSNNFAFGGINTSIILSRYSA